MLATAQLIHKTKPLMFIKYGQFQHSSTHRFFSSTFIFFFTYFCLHILLLSCNENIQTSALADFFVARKDLRPNKTFQTEQLNGVPRFSS